MLEFVVGFDLVDDGADDLEGAAFGAVVGRRGETDTALPLEFVSKGFLAGVPGLIDSDRMPAEHCHYLHARDVRFSVSEVDHLGVGNPLLVLSYAFVYLLVVMGTEDSLADLEYELGLCSIVHRNSRPDGLAGIVVDVAAGENVLELRSDGGAFDDFLKARGVDVVLDPDPMRGSIFIDQTEPVLHPFEQFDVFPELTEIGTAEGYPVLAGLVEHHLHV